MLQSVLYLRSEVQYTHCSSLLADTTAIHTNLMPEYQRYGKENRLERKPRFFLSSSLGQNLLTPSSIRAPSLTLPFGNLGSAPEMGKSRPSIKTP